MSADRPRRHWDEVRSFALALPAAEEDHPWGEPVVKVRRKPGAPPWRKGGEGVYGPMFVWLGQRDAEAPSVAVKLTTSHETAIAVAGATPTTISGLGQWGWVTVPLGGARLDLDLLCDWVEESYRIVAPRHRLAELDAGRAERPRPRMG